MAEGLSVQLSRELCDSRLGEPLWHPRNEPWRKQRKCQRAGKDFSSANISWPPAAEWLEQRESPLPLNRTGNRARKAGVHNSVLSEYSCHRTGGSKESPDCLYLKSCDRSQPLQPCLQCLLPYSPGKPSLCAGQAHQTNHTYTT